MRQRGRRPSHLISVPVDGSPSRLVPPSVLQDQERELFEELVGATAPSHLRASDVPLLVSFIQATIWARHAVRRDDLDGWERAVRVQATLATKLRLSPQTRIDPKTLGRQQQYSGS